ncbi:hypothetical protein R1sor_018429 [Riccia sorocarpa]|uniref:Uncharacterized protein n=1 Tax=Riccia sorocarpa TaxID=122646 RepID=A0ABD3IDS1_9MARC
MHLRVLLEVIFSASFATLAKFTYLAHVCSGDVGEAQLIYEDEDDAPLSAFINPTLTSRRNKSGHLTNAKNVETVTKATAEKSPASAGPGTSVQKETPPSVEAQPASVVGPANSSPEKSAPVKRRVSILKKGKPTGQHLLGKFKEPSETKTKNADAVKSEGLVFKEPKKKQESKQKSGPIKRKVRFLDEKPSREKILVTASRFKTARNAINELLLKRIPGSFPVSEAACAEVEFAQELAASTASDLKKVCEEIQPSVKQFYRRDESSSEEVPAPRSAEEKWIDARCKHLRNSMNFHHSIVRHLAVPTFSLCNIENVPPSADLT